MASSFVTVIGVVWVVGSVLVGLHAHGQNKSVIFWGGLTFFTGIIGLVAYAISLASNSPDSRHRRGLRGPSNLECPTCGATNTDSANYCQNCGDDLVSGSSSHEYGTTQKVDDSDGFHCGMCGMSADDSDEECSACGREFSGTYAA